MSKTDFAERKVIGSAPRVGRGIEAVRSIPSLDPLDAGVTSKTLIVVVVVIASYEATQNQYQHL
jgi:hypothetical protein